MYSEEEEMNLLGEEGSWQVCMQDMFLCMYECICVHIILKCIYSEIKSKLNIELGKTY